MQEWIRLSRLLVLVEHSNENALLVYNLSNNVVDTSDLERIIPVDTEFKSEIGGNLLTSYWVCNQMNFYLFQKRPLEV